jgi:hypothetical protein
MQNKKVEREKRFPWLKVLALVFMWGGVTVLASARGGGGAPSLFGIDCGTPAFYGLLASSGVFLILFFLLRLKKKGL